MEDILKRLKSGTGKITFEAGKLARVNQANSELTAMRYQLETLYNELGQATYNLSLAEEKDDSAIVELCEKITEHRRLIEQKALEIDAIKLEEYDPDEGNINHPTEITLPSSEYEYKSSETDGTTKRCPSCRKEIPTEAVFCPLCGSKV